MQTEIATLKSRFVAISSFVQIIKLIQNAAELPIHLNAPCADLHALKPELE